MAEGPRRTDRRPTRDAPPAFFRGIQLFGNRGKARTIVRQPQKPPLSGTRKAPQTACRECFEQTLSCVLQTEIQPEVEAWEEWFRMTNSCDCARLQLLA